MAKFFMRKAAFVRKLSFMRKVALHAGTFAPHAESSTTRFTIHHVDAVSATTANPPSDHVHEPASPETLQIVDNQILTGAMYKVLTHASH
jgi:hypothetical protein